MLTSSSISTRRGASGLSPAVNSTTTFGLLPSSYFVGTLKPESRTSDGDESGVLGLVPVIAESGMITESAMPLVIGHISEKENKIHKKKEAFILYSVTFQLSLHDYIFIKILITNPLNISHSGEYNFNKFAPQIPTTLSTVAQENLLHATLFFSYRQSVTERIL